MLIEIFDTHTHLDNEQFDNDRNEVIKRAQDASVNRILTVGAGNNLDSAVNAIELANSHDFIYASAGLHPHDADFDLNIKYLEELASNKKVVAIGETGLDFFRDWAPKDKQHKAFEAQIEIAKNLNKPIIIHSRDAGEECIKKLTDLKADTVGGVFHCYQENAEFAKRLLDLNFYVSFPGTITFKKAFELRETVKEIPLTQILLETDAPYMAPEPSRGKRCETGFTRLVAEKMAEIKEINLTEVAKITTENALKLFKINDL
ncbi:UNVERIFIED_CONTAM: hypothetical protein GTU68_034598 [Idotea baltica]|nr:hypothetical protein [Idotea baltica]